MVNEKDFFKKNMTPEEFEDALNNFVKACKDAGEQIPLWVRMQLDEEVITPPAQELTKALEDIDKEFGIKKEE